MINRTSLVTRLCAVLMICSLCSSYSKAQSKNILRIWFDTITVKTIPSQVVMNCWFKLEGTKPHDFRGFDMTFIYEAHQITPSNYFFSGTASEKAGFHAGNHNSQTGEASVVVLGSTELDLTKPLLFSMAFLALPRLNDTVFNDYIGRMEVIRDRFELSINSGIDSVVITDGWIKYAKQSEPEPETKKSIVVSSDSSTIAGDSVGWVSILASSLDSARISQAVFSAAFDTSIIALDTAVIGVGFASTVALTIENKLTHANFYLNSIDTSKPFTGSGEILKIKLKAHKRNDTIVTRLYDTSFFALNPDNLLDSVRYVLRDITIYGKASDTDTVIKSVSIANQDVAELLISPNPANSAVTIELDISGATLTVYTILGEKVYTSSFNHKVELQTSRYASGWYQVVVQNDRQKHKGLMLVQH